MYRLDVCECHCERIGRNFYDSRWILLKSIKAHVDIFEYSKHLQIDNLISFQMNCAHFRFIKEVSTAFSYFILAQGILSLMLLTVTIFYSKLVRTGKFSVYLFCLNFFFLESDQFNIWLSTGIADPALWLLYVWSTRSK